MEDQMYNKVALKSLVTQTAIIDRNRSGHKWDYIEFHIWVYTDPLGTSRTVCTRRLPLCRWPFPAGASLHSVAWVWGYNVGVAVPKGLLSWVHWQNLLRQNYTTFAHKAIVGSGGKEIVSHVLWDCFLSAYHKYDL